MQVAFVPLKKSLSKIPTCSCRANHWSPEHHVQYIIELEESASRRDEMGSSLLALLDFFQKASYTLWYQGSAEKAATVIIEDSILPLIF